MIERTQSHKKTSDDRPITPVVQADDSVALESSLRPSALAEYVGQSDIKKNLDIALQAAQKRQESLDHVLLHGPAGLGKTTLALIIAKEMGVHCKITSGPAIERQGDLAALLTNLQQGDVLFIDEIHRLKPVVEEVLYSAMEDFALDLMIGKGPSARSMRLQLPRFTLIGATTKMSMLSSPLRDRFGSVFHLQFYANEDICQIILRSAGLLKIKMHQKAGLLLAQSCRQTPRVANRLLRRLRDYAEVHGASSVITEETVQKGLQSLGIDHLGLDHTDRTLLNMLAEKFHGGPVGIRTLAAATHEDEQTIEDIYEPYLLQLGFLERTPRGRLMTEPAYQHLGSSLTFRR